MLFILVYRGWLGVDPEPETAPLRQEDELIDALHLIKNKRKLKSDESEENDPSLNHSNPSDYDKIVNIVNRLCKLFHCPTVL